MSEHVMRRWCGIAALALIVFPGGGVAAEPAGTPDAAAPGPGRQLFETHCGACHSLELPRSQRLDRNTWRWVVDDMVNQYGANWITEAQQRAIIDYLAVHYGPDRPRAVPEPR